MRRPYGRGDAAAGLYLLDITGDLSLKRAAFNGNGEAFNRRPALR